MIMSLQLRMRLADQPDHTRVRHSGRPSPRPTRPPPSPPPPLTQYPFPPRSLVRGGKTSPHKPRIVVSHSTCPPLSSSPHAHSFVLGTAVIKAINNNNLIGTAVINTHLTHLPRPGWAPDPLMVGIRSPHGLVVGSYTSHPGVLGSIPKREEPGKTGRHPVLK